MEQLGDKKKNEFPVEYRGITLYNPNDYLHNKPVPHHSPSLQQNKVPQKLSSTILIIPKKKKKHCGSSTLQQSKIDDDEDTKNNNDDACSKESEKKITTIKNPTHDYDDSFKSNPSKVHFSASRSQMLCDEGFDYFDISLFDFPSTPHFGAYLSGYFKEKDTKEEVALRLKRRTKFEERRPLLRPNYRLGKVPYQNRKRVPVFLFEAAYNSELELRLAEIDEVMRGHPPGKKQKLDFSSNGANINDKFLEEDEKDGNKDESESNSDSMIINNSGESSIIKSSSSVTQEEETKSSGYSDSEENSHDNISCEEDEEELEDVELDEILEVNNKLFTADSSFEHSSSGSEEDDNHDDDDDDDEVVAENAQNDESLLVSDILSNKESNSSFIPTHPQIETVKRVEFQADFQNQTLIASECNLVEGMELRKHEDEKEIQCVNFKPVEESSSAEEDEEDDDGQKEQQISIMTVSSVNNSQDEDLNGNKNSDISTKNTMADKNPVNPPADLTIEKKKVSVFKSILGIFLKKDAASKESEITTSPANIPIKRSLFQKFFKLSSTPDASAPSTPDASTSLVNNLSLSKETDAKTKKFEALMEPVKKDIDKNDDASGGCNPLGQKHKDSVSLIRKKRLKLFAETQIFFQDSINAYRSALVDPQMPALITSTVPHSTTTRTPATTELMTIMKEGLISTSTHPTGLLTFGYKSTVSESVITPAMSRRKRRLHQSLLDGLDEDNNNNCSGTKEHDSSKEKETSPAKLKGILKKRK